MTPEFTLIQKYFHKKTSHTRLGVGDDAALISVAHGMELAVSTDMLVAGTHFFHDADPYGLGWKSLAVNISDMAAMGACPKWATLSLALPEINHDWLTAFSNGFFSCAEAFYIDLIGGDTTRGPLTINVQIMGETPVGQALQRSSAQPGDDIWVSGTLGQAAMAVAHIKKEITLPETTLQQCAEALHTPQPRVTLGLALRTLAHSCIDLSDGLLADLGHILTTSNLGAQIHLETIPCNDFLSTHLNDARYKAYVLAGGDDYELCFTAAKTKREEIKQLGLSLKLPLSLIGETTPGSTLSVSHLGQNLTIEKKGFDHFDHSSTT